MISKFSETLRKGTHCNGCKNQQLTTCLHEQKYLKRQFVKTSDNALIFLSNHSILREFEIVFFLFNITEKRTFDHSAHRLSHVAVFQNNPFTVSHMKTYTFGMCFLKFT